MGRSVGKIQEFGLFLCLMFATAASAAAQNDVPMPPKPKAKVAVPERPSKRLPVAAVNSPLGEGKSTERAIIVDPDVSLKLCVSEGSLKINGWDRNEVRVFVRNGRKIGFKVLEKDAETKLPNWLLVGRSPEDPVLAGPMSDCLAGESVELDVPVGSSINLAGRTASTYIDSIKKVSVKIVEGRIDLRNISGGISAVALQGDVMVENSGGSISLETTTGNIVAFDVKPGQIGDIFKARTNSGSISLQDVDHRQIEANSISGSVNFNGELRSGGIYTFKTSNGSIRLLLPPETSCRLAASYGFGTFDSSFPYEVETETRTPGGKNTVIKIGSGDATVYLTTTSGSIGIRKRS